MFSGTDSEGSQNWLFLIQVIINGAKSLKECARRKYKTKILLQTQTIYYYDFTGGKYKKFQ